MTCVIRQNGTIPFPLYSYAKKKKSLESSICWSGHSTAFSKIHSTQSSMELTFIYLNFYVKNLDYQIAGDSPSDNHSFGNRPRPSLSSSNWTRGREPTHWAPEPGPLAYNETGVEPTTHVDWTHPWSPRPGPLAFTETGFEPTTYDLWWPARPTTHVERLAHLVSAMVTANDDGLLKEMNRACTVACSRHFLFFLFLIFSKNNKKIKLYIYTWGAVLYFYF